MPKIPNSNSVCIFKNFQDFSMTCSIFFFFQDFSRPGSIFFISRFAKACGNPV